MRQDETVQLRRYPYPYRAMLAVCSDLDETPDRAVYEQIARFCNTSAPTAMGPGVDLEVGGTIYFDMPGGQFAYWNTDEAGRSLIRALIRSGHIDCLHSYGDLADSRAHAVRALDELARHDCRLEVWVDHGISPTNLGDDIMAGHGDDMDHPAYHADLTCDQGVRYIWRGRVSSVIGQNTPARLGGLWTPRHPAASARTAAKEALKWGLGRHGEGKYAMHGANRVLRRVGLRDGRPVMEFLRSNSHWGGVSRGETAGGIGQVLTDAMLRRLIDREGVCVLYTHLGKIADPARPLDEAAVAAFGRLARAHRGGGILVATTRRLLGYIDTCDRLAFSCRSRGDRLTIDVRIPPDGDYRFDPAGLTFYVDQPEQVDLTINGARVSDPWINPPDHTGRPSISAPWPRLEFPDL